MLNFALHVQPVAVLIAKGEGADELIPKTPKPQSLTRVREELRLKYHRVTLLSRIQPQQRIERRGG
jgi:hypothetical protein